MKAEDLRIGNYVNTDNGIKKISQLSVDGNTQSDECKPIKITEDWLLKLGFKEVPQTIGDFKIEIQKNEGGGLGGYDLWVDLGIENETNEVAVLIVSEESNWLRTKIKYIHQLQNLYFSLTQKELQPTN